MRTDIITIEPEIVQFGRDNVQTIKIINNTPAPIANIFFCLYNTEKFSFSPDTFSLTGHEHILVKITLKLKTVKSVTKQFAYVKSSQINRRITLLINSFQSPQAKSRGDEGYQDLNTLSSRDYKEIQTEAIEKIIREKEAYIELLEKERNNAKTFSHFGTQESAEKVGRYQREVEQAEMKLILAYNEKESILKQNQHLQQKFEEYRLLCEADLKNYEKLTNQFSEKTHQIKRLNQEVQYLQDQGQQLIRKLEEKQTQIRQVQIQSKKQGQEIRRQSQKKFNELQRRYEEQKRTYNQSLRFAEERIKQLEQKATNTEKFKQKNLQLQRQLKRKEGEIRNLMQSIDSQRKTLRQLQGQKKKMIKYEVLNESMNDKNAELTDRLKQLEEVNQNLKEQVYFFKNKVAESDVSSDKMTQYLQIALQSCKSENDALKRTKRQLEKSLDEFMAMNRQSHDNNKGLAEQITKHKEQISILIEIKDNLQRKSQELKHEHHLAMMKLKTQNVQLLEKLSSSEANRYSEHINQLQEQLVSKARELESYKVDHEELLKKLQSLSTENSKLSQKVRKYKKEAKKELRSINDTAMIQIQREHDQKKQLYEKINELQSLIEQKQKAEKFKQTAKEVQTRYIIQSDSHLRKQRTSSRMIGIRDQRRQIQQSSHGSHLEQMHSQIGQLRQLNLYLIKEQQRMIRVLDLSSDFDLDETDLKFDEKPVLRANRFMKRIESKFRQIRDSSQISNLKEIEFLKGRLKQLESLKEIKDNASSINLTKTREQCSQLLEFVRQQMKSQYKKLNDHLKIWEMKYELLKKKIYEQYRSKIIEVLNKKDKNSISQLEVTLERFIQGMSNLSHKEAILRKQVKLKQNQRKHNAELKGKVSQLSQLLSTKKGYCSREPVKILTKDHQIEWHEHLKREAQFLTLSAQYQRLKEQFGYLTQDLGQSKQMCSRMEKELSDKSNEVLKLKRYQIEIQTNYEKQIQKQYDIIESNKKKILEMSMPGKINSKSFSKERQYTNLKQNLERQKQTIRALKEKEKMFEQLIQQSHRKQEKQHKQSNQKSRILQSVRDLKDSNRQLRSQNLKLKQKASKLQQQLQKKNAYLKNLKGDLEENRIRAQRKQQVQIDKLKQQIKRTTQQARKMRQQLDKNKKKKDKQISQYKNQIQKLKNENLINMKSLQSIIRALMDNLRDIYGRLKFYIKKKKGKDIEDHQNMFDTSRSVDIDGLKISQIFQKALTALQE